MKISEMRLRFLTLNQLTVAFINSLLFQFVIPYWWQPLDTVKYGIKQHGEEGVNIVIFMVSQWYFSLSIAWLLNCLEIYIFFKLGYTNLLNSKNNNDSIIIHESISEIHLNFRKGSILLELRKPFNC
jgi:hypothetical protein